MISCMCCDMRSMATVFSAPRRTISRSLPRSLMSLITLLASLVSASVSTKSLRW